MPEKALKTYESTLLYRKKPITLTTNKDERLYTSDDKKGDLIQILMTK